MPKIIVCDHCGKQFERSKFNKGTKNSFCTSECASAFRKNKKFKYPHKWITLICKQCGNKFETLRSNYKRRSKRFCNNECYYEHKKGDRVTIKCKLCGKKKTVYKIYVDRGQYKYCSDKCKFEDSRNGISEDRLKKTCAVCGEIFRIKPGEMDGKKRSRIHCSMDCRKRRVKKVCLNCNEEFETKLNGGNKRFCSNACYKSYRGESLLERKVRKHLEHIGITFKTQVQFENYVVDFLLPKQKKIIEADGNYWHTKKGVPERDQRKDEYLNQLGYEVIRITENVIKSGEYRGVLQCLN